VRSDTLQTPDLPEAAHQPKKKLGNRNDFQQLISRLQGPRLTGPVAAEPRARACLALRGGT
jgi:hypothetical protein